MHNSVLVRSTKMLGDVRKKGGLGWDTNLRLFRNAPRGNRSVVFVLSALLFSFLFIMYSTVGPETAEVLSG